MIKRNNMKLTIMSIMIGAALLTGCTSQSATSQPTDNERVKTVNNISIDYVKDDYYTTVNEGQATKINLGSNIEVSGMGATVNNHTVTITAGGTYIIEGSLEDGQIVIDCVTEDTIRLVLRDVDITCSNGAPIYAKNAEKVVVSLEEGTENTLVDGSEYVLEAESDEPNGAIFSKGDLTINGKGVLNVNANYKDGIVSKDKLKIMEGTINIKAVDDGIRGKDMVAIRDGNITINSGGDGIKSTNTELEAKGFVYIENGNFNITAEEDGLQAETDLEILDGTFNIVTGGGSQNGPSHIDNMMMPGRQRPNAEGMIPPEGMEMPEGMTPPEGMEMPEGMTPPEGMEMPEKVTPPEGIQMPPTGENTTTSEEDSVSMKGIKAVNTLIIHKGTFTINSADDAIHGNNSVVVSGGDLTIETGDDALHADVDLTIEDGNINITKSYEGLEGEKITINDGTIHLIASDDGVNASEVSATEDSMGDVMHASGKAEFIVNGGYLYVDASGDGLDANGSITINGGTVIVNGPTNGGNGALDYDISCNINDGTVIIAGSAQMAQTVSDTSKINTTNMIFPTAQQAGQTVAILDEIGKVVVTFETAKTSQVIMIASPLLETGKTYVYVYGGTIEGEVIDGMGTDVTYTGGTTVGEFTINENITYLNESGVTTAQESGMGMMGHGMPGGGHGASGDMRGNRGQRPGKMTTAKTPTESTRQVQ